MYNTYIYTTRVKYAQKLFKAFVQVAARSRKKHLLGHWGILGNAPFYKLLCHIATGLLLDPPRQTWKWSLLEGG